MRRGASTRADARLRDYVTTADRCPDESRHGSPDCLRHVGLPECEKCPLIPSTSSTLPCAPGSTLSSPHRRGRSSSAGPPSRAANPPSSSPPPAPARPSPPSCGASIDSCSRPSRPAPNAAASSTFPPSRPSPSISNATCAPRWSASPRPPSPKASRSTSPPSPYAPVTPPLPNALASPAIPPPPSPSPPLPSPPGPPPAADRPRSPPHPADILITTPESIYLLLTSNAREALRSVETVVLDEIHALVPTKRGSHLALSLERLEALVAQGAPSGPVPAVSRLVSTPAPEAVAPEAPRRPAKGLQRIGLSATQRPLDEVARFLGGAAAAPASKRDRAAAPTAEILAEFESANAAPRYRDVTIVDAGAPKRIDLRIEVPLDDMSRLDDLVTLPSGPASQAPVRPSIWSAIHPKLLELVRAHTSTLIFVNSRRLAERISGVVNELAGETLVRAHHGSVAADQRKEIEDRLKMGTLRGLVATSSLELGIDMGAIDLVVQIESPPSVASGMQRVGRASHHVGGTSAAIIFPKYRGDLVACAAITRAMSAGKVRSEEH